MFRPPCLLLLLVVVLGCAAHERIKRGATDLRKWKWNKTVPIPFALDPNFSPEQKATIRATVQEIAADTCLDFVENDGPVGKIFYNLAPGFCDGEVGYYGEPVHTTVRLDPGCIHTEAVKHETMHALGFRHTQCRQDRDTYVRVDSSLFVKSNGLPNGNYVKLLPNESDDYGVPYEFNSLLHYKAADKLQAVDIRYNMSMGGSYLTFLDLKLINAHYKCKEKCTKPIECQNGGYQHPRKCTECVCPRFHQGTYCEKGKTVETLVPGQSITKSFAEPMNLAKRREGPPNIWSKYPQSPYTLIKAPEGTHIRVTISHIHDTSGWPFSLRQNCNEQGVEVVDGDLTRVGYRFCMKEHVGRSFVSETNIVGWQGYSYPGNEFVGNVTFAVEGTPVQTTAVPVITTTSTKAPVVTTTTTTTKAPVITTTTATTTKAPVVTTTTTPSTSTGGAWCDA